MIVTFLGTGTSMGVPVAGASDGQESTGDPRDVRWRCSAWVRTPESSVVIDTTPEFRLQTLRSGLRHIDLVLITHEHMDHIAGLDDLRSFCYRQEQSLPLYATPQAGDSIYARFDYMFGPDRYPGAPSLDIRHPDGPFEFRDLTVTPLPARHGSVDVLGYRLNDFSYLTDVKEIPEETRQLIRGSRIMVLSGLRWKPDHPTHLTIPQAVEIAEELEVPRTYLIHMNSRVNHAESNRRLPDHVRLAYDQLRLEIPEDGS